jgi:hypothetical protein
VKIQFYLPERVKIEKDKIVDKEEEWDIHKWNILVQVFILLLNSSYQCITAIGSRPRVVSCTEITRLNGLISVL